MIREKRQFILSVLTSLFCLLILTGCPWGHMKYFPRETARVYLKGDSICFFVPDVQDYQPVFIAINLRDISLQESQFIDNPKLRLVGGQLCIPHSFYHFPDNEAGVFIIETVFHSKNTHHHPRDFIVGFKIRDRKIYNEPLTTREYDEPSNNS